MEILSKNKFLVKLIASICVFLTLINFAGTTTVYAKEEKTWGGVLMSPVINLLTAIGDSVMELLHKSIQSQNAAIIKVSGSTSWLEKIGAVVLGIVAGIVLAVVCIAAVVATSGLAAYGAAVLAAGTASATFTVSISASTVLAGAVAGVCAGVALRDKIIPDDIYLPAFSITAEEIFSNEIALFDVNFFDPMPEETETESVILGGDTIGWYNLYSQHGLSEDPNQATGIDNQNQNFTQDISSSQMQYIFNEINENQEDAKHKISFESANLYCVQMKTTQDSTYTIITMKIKEVANGVDGVSECMFTIVHKVTIDNPEIQYLTVKQHAYTREVATSSGGTMTVTWNEKTIIDESNAGTRTITRVSTAKQLQGIVSTWYFILRNIALLVLMLLLIYSGIRIVIGSTAGEKAKYKERLMDWLVAVCLIFVMHYIMVFAVELVEKITELVGKTVNGNVAYIELTEEQSKNAEKVLKGFNTTSEGDDDGDAIAENYGDYGAIVWPTDLAGTFRIQSQMTEEGTSAWVGYSFCYVVLVLFTLFFAFTYAKRVLYMAFLTIIAPLVAMTYPIDKITDGKAQAFDAWLKEYIFNLMIQPLHLLLYSILVTSAFSLATTSPIYALVAIGFMMPAEKLMRRFFGFEKAKTPGLLGGAAGAAIAMSGLQSILKGGGGGGSHGHAGNSSSAKSKDQNQVKMARKNSVDVMGAIAGEPPSATPATRQSAGSNTTPATRQPAGGNTNPPRRTASGRMDADGNPIVNPEDYGENRSRVRPSSSQMEMDEYGNPIVNPEDYEGDTSRIDQPREEDFELDEDDILGNTTLGSEDWDHDGIQTVDQPEPEEEQQQQQPQNDTPVEEVQNENENVRNESRLRKIGRAVGAASMGAGKQLAVKALTGIHPLKFAGRVAAGAAAGAAGLAIGVASGDPNKAFQYTTAGAMAGNSLAKSMSNNTLIDGTELKDDVKKAYYGDDYEKEMWKKEKEKFKKDRENLDYLRKTLKLKDIDAAKKVMETTGERCYNEGITNIEDIATMHKLTEEKKAEYQKLKSKNQYNKSEAEMDKDAFNYAVAARNYAKRLPSDTKSMSYDKIEKYQKTWENEFKDKGYNNADQLSKEAWNAVVRYNKTQSGLKDL